MTSNARTKKEFCSNDFHKTEISTLIHGIYAPKIVLPLLFISFASFNTFANPVDGQLISGSATISLPASKQLMVIQHSDRAVIDWRSFSIAPDEITQFFQPSASSAILNRVTGNQVSQILGKLAANGQVLLVNPNGIVFGQNSRVDVGSLIASTSNISNINFMAGKYNFDQPGNATATVSNLGTISVSEGGLVALVAPAVKNSGVIQAHLGKVALAAGNTFTLDLYGDNLLTFAADSQVLQAALGVDGKVVDALIDNAGNINADGGTVLLAANTAKNIVDHAINMNGIVQARTVSQEGGVIVLDGGENGNVNVSGNLDASGIEIGEKGGIIKVLGGNVAIIGTSTLDATGITAGGTVLVGGNFQGMGNERHALNTLVENGVKIDASAILNGDGGKIVLWSDQKTESQGSLVARGGLTEGNGGVIEVSSKNRISVGGLIDTSSVKGKSGQVLFDPLILDLGPNGDIKPDELSKLLDLNPGSEFSALETIYFHDIADGKNAYYLILKAPNIVLRNLFLPLTTIDLLKLPNIDRAKEVQHVTLDNVNIGNLSIKDLNAYSVFGRDFDTSFGLETFKLTLFTEVSNESNFLSYYDNYPESSLNIIGASSIGNFNILEGHTNTLENKFSIIGLNLLRTVTVNNGQGNQIGFYKYPKLTNRYSCNPTPPDCGSQIRFHEYTSTLASILTIKEGDYDALSYKPPIVNGTILGRGSLPVVGSQVDSLGGGSSGAVPSGPPSTVVGDLSGGLVGVIGAAEPIRPTATQELRRIKSEINSTNDPSRLFDLAEQLKRARVEYNIAEFTPGKSELKEAIIDVVKDETINRLIKAEVNALAASAAVEAAFAAMREENAREIAKNVKEGVAKQFLENTTDVAVRLAARIAPVVTLNAVLFGQIAATFITTPVYVSSRVFLQGSQTATDSYEIASTADIVQETLNRRMRELLPSPTRSPGTMILPTGNVTTPKLRSYP